MKTFDDDRMCFLGLACVVFKSVSVVVLKRCVSVTLLLLSDIKN